MLAGRMFHIHSSVWMCCPFPRFMRMDSWKFRRASYIVTMDGNHIPKYLKCTHILSFNDFSGLSLCWGNFRQQESEKSSYLVRHYFYHDFFFYMICFVAIKCGFQILKSLSINRDALFLSMLKLHAIIVSIWLKADNLSSWSHSLWPFLKASFTLLPHSNNWPGRVHVKYISLRSPVLRLYLLHANTQLSSFIWSILNKVLCSWMEQWTQSLQPLAMDTDLSADWNWGAASPAESVFSV